MPPDYSEFPDILDDEESLGANIIPVSENEIRDLLSTNDKRGVNSKFLGSPWFKMD